MLLAVGGGTDCCQIEPVFTIEGSSRRPAELRDGTLPRIFGECAKHREIRHVAKESKFFQMPVLRHRCRLGQASLEIVDFVAEVIERACTTSSKNCTEVSQLSSGPSG